MAQKVEYKDLLNAGVHFGHLTRKWDPRMAPYIFMERNGIHIIDLNKTLVCLDQATASIKSIVKSGRKIMFVATKKQAKELVAAEAARLKMPFVTERWLGGMLTNFVTVRKSLKKLTSIEKLLKDETTSANLNKKEKLMLGREREKLLRVLGGINEMQRLPAALFIVDIKKEHIAIAEAKKLGIPVFAMVDTNSDPTSVEFPIPANDDAYKSIAVVTYAIGQAIEEGLMERRRDKDDDKNDEEIMLSAEIPAGVAPEAVSVVLDSPVAVPVEELPVVEEIADVVTPVEEPSNDETPTPEV
jgi:small subunit ribosomal protein S2